MSTYNKIILGLSILVLSLSSCSDFLKEVSQDEIKPSNVDDLRALMNSDAYPYGISTDYYLEILSDNTVCNGLQNTSYTGYYQNGAAIFCWNKEMFDGDEAFPADADSWLTYYGKIKGCNVVKDYLGKVGGSESDKNALLGQVLFLRAFYYLRLVMIYGQPYSGKNIDPTKSLGVPLILKMDVSDQYPTRNTLKEVYDQIESDLLQSADLLEKYYTSSSVFRVGATSAYALLSRFYLYRGLDTDMDKVIAYSTKAINQGPALTNLSSFKSNFGSKGIYDTSVSSETLWIFGSPTYTKGTYFSNVSTGGNIMPYTVSNDLMNMYDQVNDLRYASYYYKQKDSKTGLNYSLTSGKIGMAQNSYGDHGIRVAEVYLNQAEALARQFQATGDDSKRVAALNDLNILRASRYAQGTYKDISFTDAAALLQFCYDERRRELCFEDGFRWFDMKRLGLSAKHTYIDTSGSPTEFTLNSWDLLYALPIPQTAIDKNYKLEQNPR